jgi:hypothetical protein
MPGLWPGFFLIWAEWVGLSARSSEELALKHPDFSLDRLTCILQLGTTKATILKQGGSPAGWRPSVTSKSLASMTECRWR